MSRFIHAGISIAVPPGWEAAASGGSFRLLPSGAREPTVVHLGTFPLPPNGASFGADAVESMRPTDVLIVLFEYGREVAGTAPFAFSGIPAPLHPRQFDRNALQHGVPGQSGLQRFFTVNGRPFCLYVVLGSHIDRADLIPDVNQVLATLEIG
jgi:hypothetical protein